MQAFAIYFAEEKLPICETRIIKNAYSWHQQKIIKMRMKHIEKEIYSNEHIE